MSFSKIKDSCDWDKSIPLDRHKEYNHDYWDDIHKTINNIEDGINRNMTDNHNYITNDNCFQNKQ